MSVRGPLAPRLLALLLATLYLWLGTRPRIPAALERFPDWLGHGAAYALLAAVAQRGFPSLAPGGVAAACTLHGGLLEWLQLHVPGRSAELEDLVADALGSLLGVALRVRRP